MTSPPQDVSDDVRMVADKVRDLMSKGRVDTTSAIAIIRCIGDVCTSNSGVPTGAAAIDIIEAVVVEIAKGRDGVLGTADDLIPPKVLGVIQTIVHQELVRDLASWAAEVAFLPRVLRYVTRLFGVFSKCRPT